jgi:hypothetical protein
MLERAQGQEQQQEPEPEPELGRVYRCSSASPHPFRLWELWQSRPMSVYVYVQASWCEVVQLGP